MSPHGLASATSFWLLLAGCSSDDNTHPPADPADSSADVGVSDAGVDAPTDGIAEAAPDGGDSSAALCPWQHPPGTEPPFVVGGTTALQAGDIALLIRTSTYGLDESCDGWFVAARAPIVASSAGGGTFSLTIPAPPPPGAQEVAEAWPEERAKSPRVVAGALVALEPGTGDHLVQTDIETKIEFVALNLVVYAYRRPRAATPCSRRGSTARSRPAIT